VTAITAQQALDYQERWKIAKEREVHELHASSLDERARQSSVLMASHSLFRRDPHREQLAEEVRQRWMRIRHAQGD
jgi:hypothetical protein